MKQKRTMCSIILAAGKGTRIGLTSTHKTCLPVGGRPVIVRSIEAYQAAGVSPHVVVVGTGAQHVLKTVGRHLSDALFAYQPEPLGTGNAAKCGVRVLTSVGYQGDVLVTAGDKLIEETVIRKMIRKFRASPLDCLFLVGQREDSPTSGRVIYNEDGEPVRIVELADIRRARLLSQIRQRAEAGDVSPQFVAHAIAAQRMKRRKAEVAFGQLLNFASGTVHLSADEIKAQIPPRNTVFPVQLRKRTRRLSPDEADSAEFVNLSVYALKMEALEFAVKKMKADNAQNEEYLTDMIETLARARTGNRRRFKLSTLCVEDPHQVMGFNNLEELRAIEEYVRGMRGLT
jgi:N-acetylgalactosamine kinase